MFSVKEPQIYNSSCQQDDYLRSLKEENLAPRKEVDRPERTFRSKFLRKSILPHRCLPWFPFAPFLPKVRTSLGGLCRWKTSFGSDFHTPCPVNAASTLPFGVENAPFLTLGANFRNFLTTLHLPIIYIIIYMELLGAKFGNTQQAEVRTSCTFLPSSAKLRNISRPFCVVNCLLVRTSRTFLRHFQGSAMKVGSRNRFSSRSPHLMETFQVCRCEL